MKKFLLLIVVFFSMTLFAQKNRQQVKLLKSAYSGNSREKLQLFLKKWSEEIKPVSAGELLKLNDTLRNVYETFACFYSPEGLYHLGDYNPSYAQFGYLLLQNKIKVRFRERLFYTPEETDSIIVAKVNEEVKDSTQRRKYLKRSNGEISPMTREAFAVHPHLDFPVYYSDSILNFRPNTGFTIRTPLFLTSGYYKMLIEFLGGGNSRYGRSGKDQDEKALAESEQRKHFLENFIIIHEAYWGAYWQLYSVPYVYSVTFDKHMQYARIDFKMNLSAGDALLKKENGKWVIVSAKITKQY